MKPVTLKACLFALLFLLGTFGLAQTFLDSDAFRALEPEAQNAVSLIVHNDEVAAFLETHSDWRAEAYADSETDWHVDFYLGDEWLAYAHVNVETSEVYDTRIPVELSEEEFGGLREKIETLVFNDAEIEALLVDPDWWDYEVRYDAYDQNWWVEFWKEIEAVTVALSRDGERFYIEDVYDPKAFDEEEARRVARDQAVDLAWQAEGISAALDGVDDWRAYAEQQEGSRWTVEFAGEGRSLFTALVDLGSGEVIEAGAE